MKFLLKLAALALAGRAATELWHRREHLRDLLSGDADAGPVSAPGAAVDHNRQPGVPPPANEDYQDDRDVVGALSFPASDPPSSW